MCDIGYTIGRLFAGLIQVQQQQQSQQLKSEKHKKEN